MGIVGIVFIALLAGTEGLLASVLGGSVAIVLTSTVSIRTWGCLNHTTVKFPEDVGVLNGMVFIVAILSLV